MNKLNNNQKELVNNNLNLVYFIINKLNIIVNEDIIQEGCLALCKAALNYKESKGKFSTFACNYIKNSIIQYLNYNNVVKPKRKKGKFQHAEVNEYDDELLYLNTDNIISKIVYDVYYENFFNLLDEEEKLIIKRKMQKEKVKEIANEIGRTPRSVYNKIYVIRDKFKTFKEEIDDGRYD